MDIQHLGKAVARESGITLQITPRDVDPDSLKILSEAGFFWDADALAFKKCVLGHPESPYHTTIEYRFLREQKLVVSSTMDEHEKTGQLQRLRILLQSMD